MIYATVQTLILALVLAWSAGFAWRKFFPRSARAAQACIAHVLSAHVGLRALGERLRPVQVANGAGCGTGGGCSSCGNCAVAAPRSDLQPLVFTPRSKI
jgi:hypothetical protein